MDASTLPLADTLAVNSSNQKSAELQLSGKTLADRLDWVGGLYWFRDNGGAPSEQSPASQSFLAALGAVNALSEGELNLAPYFTPRTRSTSRTRSPTARKRPSCMANTA